VSYHTFVQPSISSMYDDVSIEGNIDTVLLISLTRVYTIVC